MSLSLLQKNFHTSNLKLIIKKKSNLQILHVTFCKYFLKKSQKYKWSPKQLFFVFSLFKIVLKSGSQIRIIYKLLSENLFQAQFFENCFYTILKTKTKILLPIRP